MSRSNRQLENHIRALDLSDANAKLELDAYRSVVALHRAIGVQLVGVAKEMAGYRDLPIARHDMTVMTDARNASVFARYVDAEKDLLAYLQNAIERDQKMLDDLRDAR